MHSLTTVIEYKIEKATLNCITPNKTIKKNQNYLETKDWNEIYHSK